MGVDARILLKITKKKSWLNLTQIRQYSAQLTNVIGHEHFFLRAEENRHAISDVLEDTRNWAAKYPGEYPNFDGKTAVWSQDGDDIVALPNEQFLEVHSAHRYYGEEYPRGDWKTLSWTMMWCIVNIPDCEVWYGGDSSGICAEHMTSRRMNSMTKYYLTSGNDEYWMNSKTNYPCEFCGVGCVCSGGGGGIGFWHCASCGSQWVSHDPSGDRPRSFRDETPGGFVTKYDRYGIDRDLKDTMACFSISEQVRAGKRPVYPFDGTFRQVYPVSVPDVDVQKTLAAGTPLLEAGTPESSD